VSEPTGASPRAASSDAGLLLTGRLEETSFADLMKSLGRSRETALVTLSRETVRKTVYVQEGRVIFAQSSDPDERLGETMLRDGMISVDQYDESVKLIRPGKRQGTILVELGYVTPAELVKGVKSQVEHVVLNLFTWRTGEYRIEIREFDTRDIITLNISTENLIYAGVKRGAGWSQVLRGVGGTLDTVLDRAPDADTRLYKLDLTDDEAHVYSLANGRLSIAQIAAMSYMSNFDTCVTLYGLTCCGILNVVSSKDAESLFREQVAEFEIIEIRDRVDAFNDILRLACEQVAPHVGARMKAFLDECMAEVIDEHYDALREVEISTYEIDPDLVIENVREVDAGSRRRVVEEALAAVLSTLLLKVRLEVSAELEQQLAQQASAMRRK
jgi:hypothetical protein